MSGTYKIIFFKEISLACYIVILYVSVLVMYVYFVFSVSKPVRGHSILSAKRTDNPEWVQEITNSTRMYNAVIGRINNLLGRYNNRYYFFVILQYFTHLYLHLCNTCSFLFSVSSLGAKLSKYSIDKGVIRFIFFYYFNVVNDRYFNIDNK